LEQMVLLLAELYASLTRQKEFSFVVARDFMPYGCFSDRAKKLWITNPL